MRPRVMLLVDFVMMLLFGWDTQSFSLKHSATVPSFNESRDVETTICLAKSVVAESQSYDVKAE